MPRVRPNVLERDALTDLWKHSLSRIPTLCGRLVYLSSLRDSNSGAYRHHGLAAAFGRDESARAMQESHLQVFVEWLALPLQGKAGDVRDYLASTDEGPGNVAAFWLRSGQPRNLIPEQSFLAQREHFERDMGTLLEIFRNDPALLGRPPESTQSL